jgi:hypothetical protein
MSIHLRLRHVQDVDGRHGQDVQMWLRCETCAAMSRTFNLAACGDRLGQRRIEEELLGEGWSFTFSPIRKGVTARDHACPECTHTERMRRLEVVSHMATATQGTASALAARVTINRAIADAKNALFTSKS